MADYPKRQPELNQVKQALQILSHYADELDQEDPQFVASQRRYTQRNRGAGWLLVLALIPGGLTVVQPQADWWWLYAFLLVAALVLAIWANVAVIREQREVLQIYARPKQALLKRLESLLDTEEQYLQPLLALDRDALILAHARLEQASEVLKEKTESLFGLVSKVGLFPGIVAIGVALIPALKSSGNNLILVVLALLLFWNHSVSYNLQLSLTELKQLSGLAKRALSLEREEAAPILAAAVVPADPSSTG